MSTGDRSPPAALFHYPVVLRGNRPPIKTARDWVDLAIENDEVQAYPWTRKYSQRVVPSMLQKFDYAVDSYTKLPQDPITRCRTDLILSRDQIFEGHLTTAQINYLANLSRQGSASIMLLERTYSSGERQPRRDEGCASRPLAPW
jgi:hypothetical protein